MAKNIIASRFERTFARRLIDHLLKCGLVLTVSSGTVDGAEGIKVHRSADREEIFAALGTYPVDRITAIEPGIDRGGWAGLVELRWSRHSQPDCNSDLIDHTRGWDITQSVNRALAEAEHIEDRRQHEEAERDFGFSYELSLI
jgi:hypothetical protein